MVRLQSIDLKEKVDGMIASRIMSSVFGKRLTNWKLREYTSPTDALFTGSTKEIESHYDLEIKTTTNDAWRENGFIVKFAKWIKARNDRDRRDEDEKLLWIFLCEESGEYYIFNLDEINPGRCNVAVMPLKATQYASSSQTVYEPVFFLQCSDAVYNGFYKITDEEAELLKRAECLKNMGK